MKKREVKQIIVIFTVILLAALLKDVMDEKLEKGGILYRDEAGGQEQEIDLLAEIEGLEETYIYQFVVEPVEITREKAADYIAQARSIIETDFRELGAVLPVNDTYVSDLVEAEWIFTPGEYVTHDGNIEIANIPKEGILIQASVLLACGQYEEIYTFPIFLEDSLFSEEEKIKAVLEREVRELGEQTDSDKIELPLRIGDKTVHWSEKKEYLFLKIFLLEITAFGLIFVMGKKKEEQEKEKRKIELELSYADVVNQLAVLLRAGMTMRQAWNRIAVHYGENEWNRNSLISAAIQHLNMRLKEGEKERVAYEQFAKEADVICYRRLMRVLVANLEKGTSDLCGYLEEESRRAYEDRIVAAKRKGEEASTKMLLPLMIMMILVMAIVLIPAIVSFSV